MAEQRVISEEYVGPSKIPGLPPESFHNISSNGTVSELFTLNAYVSESKNFLFALNKAIFFILSVYKM